MWARRRCRLAHCFRRQELNKQRWQRSPRLRPQEDRAGLCNAGTRWPALPCARRTHGRRAQIPDNCFSFLLLLFGPTTTSTSCSCWTQLHPVTAPYGVMCGAVLYATPFLHGRGAIAVSWQSQHDDHCLHRDTTLPEDFVDSVSSGVGVGCSCSYMALCYCRASAVTRRGSALLFVFRLTCSLSFSLSLILFLSFGNV